jgi:hypothetical protein
VIVVDDVIAEVEDDLAHGDHASARRRLREALVTRPHRLDLRRRLAEVYRMLGDLPQAGRWGFLEEDAPDDEIQAFRTACGEDASHMLEALAWGEDDEGEEEDEAQVTATAWERIAELRRAVSAARKQEGLHRHRADRPGQPPAVPYPFTPPGGITRPAAVEVPPKKKPRLRELFGLVLVIVGLLIVLAVLLAIAGGAFWLIKAFVDSSNL